MNIYLAAKFDEQPVMLQWAQFLRHHGHFITSRWLLANETISIEQHQSEALKDLSDIDICDIMISKTHNRGDLFTGGGRHIEFGYAYAKGKLLINVGGWEAVFHHLPGVITVSSIEDTLKYL
jgi:nucleoside 2-deoxyribosyltransferase